MALIVHEVRTFNLNDNYIKELFHVSTSQCLFLLFEQGEVEQIAMMKPKAPSEHEDGMLEFLEDIIGSSRFKVPIEQLAKRVEELNELRGEKVDILIIRIPIFDLID